MRMIIYICYLVYSYYLTKNGGKSAWFNACLAITFFIFLHIMLIASVLSYLGYIKLPNDNSRGERYLLLLIGGAPIFFLVHYGLSERRMVQVRKRLGYEHFDKEIIHRSLLLIYVIALFVSIIAFAILAKK